MPIPAAADPGTRAPRRRWLALALVAASVCAARDAGAATLVEWGDGSFAIDGAYRFRLAYASEVPAYATPPQATLPITEGLDAGLTGEHRLRVEPRLELFGQLSVHAQIDVLDGVLFSDTGDRSFLAYSDQPPPNELGDSLDSFRVNRAWAEWRSPAGTLRFGRQPSHWGLGMVANDGDRDDAAFGDSHLGDASDRVLFGTKPLSVIEALTTGTRPDAASDPLTLGLGYDFGVDRGAVVEPGDDVTQYLAALLWDARGSTAFREPVAHRGAGGPRGAASRIGFYAVRREQTHDDRLVSGPARPAREILDAWVLDTSGRIVVAADTARGFELRVEWEAAYVTGKTNFTVSRVAATPSDPFPVSDAEQWGGIARLVAESESVAIRLEGGAASGDGNRFDDRVTDFRFHPDYNVGLILFDELLATVTAAQAFNVVDQLGEGGPVAFLGANYLASDGSVTNALYLNPVVEVDPVPGTSLVAGLVWARALEPWVDPFNDAFFGGGAGTLNSFGGDVRSKDLGVEVDVAIHQALPLGLDVVHAEAALEYGHLFSGAAFRDGQGADRVDIDEVRLRLDLGW
ncbi:MAG: hypothetical protein U0610_29535 [bacterium]